MTANALGAPVAHQLNSEDHHKALEQLFLRIGELSSLPSVAGRILQVAGDADSDATDLLQVVQQDPTLAIRILRTANSSFFGLSNEVADLQTAISLLGFVGVRNLALTVYVARLCEEESAYRDFSRERLWKHMVSVGAVARMVSQLCGRAEPEEAYIAGLLHDIGILLIDQYMHAELCRVIDRVYQGESTIDAERAILTFDHTDLGAYIARQCSLPDRITNAIRYHHRCDEYKGHQRDLIDIVVVSNDLVSGQGCTAKGIYREQASIEQVYRSLGLSDEQMSTLHDKLETMLKSAKVLAEI